METELYRPLPSIEATSQLAADMARAICPSTQDLDEPGSLLPMAIALNGTLGAGKTQFVRAFAMELGVPELAVTSPTYVLLQTYVAHSLKLFHFDFYRLQTVEQVWDLGFDELVEQPCVVLIEWAEKFPQCLPADRLTVTLQQLPAESESSPSLPSCETNQPVGGNTLRAARVSAVGKRAELALRLLNRLSEGRVDE